MVVDQIQPGPILCFTWAKPNNSVFYFYFPINSCQLHGPSPTFQPFNLYLGFGLSSNGSEIPLLNFRAGPTSQMRPSSNLGPTCHVHLINWSHTPESCKFVNLFSQLGPNCQVYISLVFKLHT